MKTLNCDLTILSSSARAGLALCALLAGCADDSTGGRGPDLEDSATSGEEDDDGMDTEGAEDTEDTESAEDSSGDEPAEPAVCGDGVAEGDEECDDGINDGSYGSCNDDCTLAAFCGDASRNGVEETCDDGNEDSTDGCLADCSIPDSCETIKAFDPGAADGPYLIDQDGEGGEDAIQVFCDMSSLITEFGEPQSTPDGFGWNTAGADVAVAHIGAGAKPDLMILHVDDPFGGNKAYYQIGWDLDEDGEPTLGWSERRELPGDFGTNGTGAGLALADIDGDGAMEMMVTHVQSEFWGDNRGFYRIGWTLDDLGQVTGGWSDPVEMPNEFGGNTAEAGAEMVDLDGNGALDLISFHVREEFGADEGYYQIGWNFDQSGEPSVWSDMMLVPGDFNDAAAGITVVRTEPKAAPSLLVFHVSGNSGHLRVGRQLDVTGQASGGWSEPVALDGSWGGASRYGGLAAADIDQDGGDDLVFFHIDTNLGDNPGFFQWGKTL